MISDVVERAAARARRRTWVAGGILMVLSAVMGLVARFELAWMRPAQDVLWALSVLILVVGLGSAGSITGRRPFPSLVVLLQVVVANQLVLGFLTGLVPRDPGNLHAQEDAVMAVTIPYYGVLFSVTVAAVILIGAAGAVPRPWNWAPLWVLALSSISVAASLALITSPEPGHTVSLVLFSVPGVAVLLLGVLAIILGVRVPRSAGVMPETAVSP